MNQLDQIAATALTVHEVRDAGALHFVPVTLDALLAASPDELSRCDIARINLLCATGLPGAEKLDVAKCLRRLDFMAEHIRKETAHDLPRFRANPKSIYKADTPQTESHFRVAHLAAAMQGEFKMHYDARFLRDPKQKAKVNWRAAFADSRAILIHGLLGEKRSGIFTPISVVAAAIGRRLGYPLRIACTPFYDWVRWDVEGERFNAEINDGGCHIVLTDEGYRTWPDAMRPEQERSGHFMRNLTPAEELALSLSCRARVLESNSRFEESLAAWAKCCFLAPTNPEFSRRAKVAAGEAMFMRKHRRAMQWEGKRFMRPVAVVDEDPRNLLESKVAALVFAIAGHVDETEGRSVNALKLYRLALDTDRDNPDHNANFERSRAKFHEESVQGHIRTQGAIRHNAPRVKLPPLEESLRQF